MESMHNSIKLKRNITNMGQLILVVVCAVTPAVIALYYARQHLNGYEYISCEDMYRVVFFSNQTKSYDYIDLQNIFLYMPLTLFLIVGTFLTTYPFLSMHKTTIGFLLLRYGDMKQAVSHIRGKSFQNCVLYCIVYYVTVFIGVYSQVPESEQGFFWMNIPWGLVLGMLCKIAFLTGISYLALYYYRKEDEGRALFLSILFILLILLIDIPIEGLCIITYKEDINAIVPFLVNIFFAGIMARLAKQPVGKKEAF